MRSTTVLLFASIFLLGCASSETGTGVCKGNVLKYFNLSDGTIVTARLEIDPSAEPHDRYTYTIHYTNGSTFECPCWLKDDAVVCTPGHEGESECFQTILETVQGQTPLDC